MSQQPETPDQAYDRILAEEQGKGSSPAVAEARAKAGRHRAKKGIPTDPAGAAAASAASAAASQAGAAAAEAPATQSPAEVPAAEVPAAQSPAEVPAAEVPAAQSPAEVPAAEVPAEAAAAASSSQPAPAAQPAAASAGAAATAAAAAPATAVATAPKGRGAAAKAARVGVNGGGASPDRIQRLLAVVKPEAIQRVEREPIDRVNTWPHLMAAEMVALLTITAFLVIYSTFINAPFRELANINVTPNPSKAPWYFLGLQELLRYFHPQIAGVTIPQWIILGLMATPYIDRNPSSKPHERKLAIVMFTIFMLMNAILVILGSIFRGPGFNFIYPWDCGAEAKHCIFFEL